MKRGPEHPGPLEKIKSIDSRDGYRAGGAAAAG
jgi:hypothetical protein